MSYQVLARKWRPRRFEEMVGQQHVVRALVNALNNDRLHHAFLFTGTRGVGKTTIARILAKSLNCDTGVSARPCGECGTCREVDEGRFIDLIEVDAASRTKVEDTRELMENVQYAPTRGRYKVYLIDEVHMLSAHSFNALLKTLEEPPPHVKFLLATTDPQKVPVTVLSRCLQFALKRLPAGLIAEHLVKILEAEGVGSEPAAIERIARAAEGSMRDALSLLDQAIAYGGGALREDEVRAMLGSIDQQHVFAVLDRVVAGDAEGVLAEIDRLSEQAPDYADVLAEIITALQRVAVAQAVPQAIDDSLGDREHIEALASAASPEEVQLYYQIAVTGRRDLALVPDPRGGFDMALLRMLAFRPAGEHAAPHAAAPAASKPQQAAPAGHSAGPAASEPGKRAAAREHRAAAKPRHSPSRSAEIPPWGEIVAALRLGGMARELAMHCSWHSRKGEIVRLVLDGAREQVRSGAIEKRLEEALQEYFGAKVRLRIEVGEADAVTPAKERERAAAERQAAAEAAVREDPTVKSLQDTFAAEIRDGSTRPVE